MGWQNITTLTKIGILTAALGFFVRFTSTGMFEMTPGGDTACTHMDFAALCLGGLAMALGGAGAVKTRDLKDGQTLNLVLCLLVAAIGFFHLLRGLGLVWNPCGAW